MALVKELEVQAQALENPVAQWVMRVTGRQRVEVLMVIAGVLPVEGNYLLI
jgi:hypothetical protein